MKKLILITAMLSMILFTNKQAMSDTLLFPFIAVNVPNVTTFVSVIDTNGNLPNLTYIYRYKDTTVSSIPNHTGSCATTSFTRNTSRNDIVTFDTSGTFNSGNALFNDPTFYNGSFALGGTGAKRAYLLVTQSNASGVRTDSGTNRSLWGEAMLIDIASGAAWGYKAFNDKNREDFTFDFTGVFEDHGIVPFFPLNEWTTKIFITPIGSNMDTANIQRDNFLLEDLNTGNNGVYNRATTFITFTKNVSVRCTSAVDLKDFLDSTALAAVETTGGWGKFDEDAVYPFIAYKLEYVVNNSTYGGTNNNAVFINHVHE